MLAHQRLEEENPDEKLPGPPGWGLDRRIGNPASRKKYIAHNPRTQPRNSDGNIRRLKQRKRLMNIGVWNVQGIRGKTEEITKELKRMKIDIAVITETKRKGRGIEQNNEFIHIYSGIPKDQRAKRGVSLLINRKLQKSITNWETVNERMVTLNLNTFGHRLTIIGVYAPNNDETDILKDQYEQQLNQVLRQIGNTREILLIGDMNARTGKGPKHPIIGAYGEETLNDNGERLIMMCEQHKLRILNGYYKHKDIHKYTWRQETRKLKSIIDYVIIKQDTKIRPMDVRAHRGPDCGSDHYLVKAKIHLPPTINSHNRNEEKDINTTTIPNKKYNIESLKEESTKMLYKNRLRQYLKDYYSEKPIEELYQHIKECIHQAAREALGEEILTRRKNNFWWTENLEHLKDEKQKLHQKWLQSKNVEHLTEYKLARTRFKREILKEKNEQWENKCNELDGYIGGRRTTEVWKFLRNLKNDNNNKITLKIINDKEWHQYFKNMLTEQRPEYQDDEEEIHHLEGQIVRIDEETYNTAIKRQKNGRAAGPGGIPAELIKHGPSTLHLMIRKLFERCINENCIPTEWKVSWITPIFKKGAKNQCTNYRGLSVNSTISRLYGRILTTLIERDYNVHQVEEQAGFRAGRSTIDNLFSLTQIIEKRTAINQETHMVFVDLTKAYDNIPVKKLFKVLEESPINITLIKAIKQMYTNISSSVKIGKELTPTFAVTKGLRQGCSMSPILFNIYLDKALLQWRRKCNRMGIPIDDYNLYTLHFADDQVVFAQEYDDIEYMTRKLFEEYNKWGLTVNLTKSEYMCAGGQFVNLQMDNGTTLDACESYTYLGSQIHNSGRYEPMINTRVNNARKITGALNAVLWQKNIRNKTKLHIYDSLIKSSLTYGCEVWQISRRTENKLLATEMDVLRRSAGKSRLERVRNEEIRRIIGREKTVMEDIRQKQLIWYGHVNRMDQNRVPKKILNWNPLGRRKRGRPRETWKLGITKAMSERDLREEDWTNRDYWRLGTGRRPHSL